MPDVNHELLRVGFDSVDSPLFLADAAGSLVEANAHFLSLFGWGSAHATPITSIVSPDERPAFDAGISRLTSGELDELRCALRAVREDGSEFDAMIGVAPALVGGRLVGLVGNVRPIDTPAVGDEPRVAKLLEHSASTLTLIDVEGHVLETAGRYRITLGYPREFWESRSLFDIVAPDDVARALELREELVSSPGHVVHGDFTVLDAEGVPHIVEVNAVNLLHDDDIRGIVVTSHNVTAERSARRDLAVLRDEAVADAERRSALLATVSHELRNPLHALAGLSELLASDAAMPDAQRALAGTLHRQATQLARVTDDLLETARLELGEMRLRIGPTRLHDIVDDVTALARAAAPGSDVEIRATIDRRVPAVVLTDGSRIHQLVWNLVSNAVKFTDYGSIDIRVAPGGAVADRFPLVIEVSDTGSGIPADEHETIFAPFRTVSDDGDRSGAGLGLAIVSHIVDLLGGTIGVESEDERGTTFRVVMPVEHHETGTARQVDAHYSVGKEAGPVVLVVEDNEVNQQLARHQLSRLGMSAIVVDSAEDCIAMVRSQHVDVILMDHQLPGMNGRDATLELRRLGMPIPIIGITASATAADERDCIEAGMNAFLPKPVRMAQLSDALDLVLRVADDEWSSTEAAAIATPTAVVVEDACELDLAVLAALDDELADPEIVETLVESFLRELGSRRADIAGDDYEVAKRQAHTLKSSARLLGATALADACQLAEVDPSALAAIDGHASAAESALMAWLAARSERSAS